MEIDFRGAAPVLGCDVSRLLKRLQRQQVPNSELIAFCI
jgi:hypothetical protein